MAMSTTAASTSVNRRCRAVGVIVAIEDSNLSATVYSVKAPTVLQNANPSLNNRLCALIVNLIQVKCLPDIEARPTNVCFTPKCGHWSSTA